MSTARSEVANNAQSINQPNSLSDLQLLALYYSHCYIDNFDVFKKHYREANLAEYLEIIINNPEFVRHHLFKSIDEGNFDLFVMLLERNMIYINASGGLCNTLLHEIIRMDVFNERHPKTQALVRMAEFLLEKGASIDIKAHGLFNTSSLSVRGMLSAYEYGQSNSVTSYLYHSIWAAPSEGKHVFPVVRAHINRLEAEREYQPSLV